MLHILLMILKIIGIILLAILGILILLLLIVLFVPVKYLITFESRGDLKSTRFYAKFSWMLHLISGQALYENEELDWKVKVAWKEFSEKNEKEMIPETSEENKEDVEEKSTETSTETSTEHSVEHAAEEQEAEKTVSEDSEHESEEKKEESKEAKSDKLEKIKYTIQSICDKIKLVIEFLEAEEHLKALSRVKKEVIRLLNFLRPKKLEGNIRFGLDDPYQTGQILAVLSILYPIYGENVQIYPDFEEKVLEGNLYLKGHIRGIYAVIVVWNIILDKYVRATFNDIKTLLK